MQASKILIIDDDPLVRDVFSAVFSHSGRYATEFAENGVAALEKVKETDYDVVFTDLSMPEKSGIDFMREAVRLKPSLPVVVITGNSTTEVAINAMREGAKDFISKPFNISTITSIADRIIGEKRLRTSLRTDAGQESYIGRLNAELFKRLREISILQAVSAELDGIYSNKDVYEKIVDMTARLLPVREASFGIIEHGAVNIRTATGAGMRTGPIASSVFDRVIATGQHQVLSSGDRSPFTGTPLITPLLAIPFTINGESFGLITLSHKEDGSAFTEDEISLALTFVKKAAQRIENNALYEVFYNNLTNTLKALVLSIEARDRFTKQHSERVTSYAIRIAEAMGLSAEDKDVLRFGGYLHDIGKIGVRDTILLKPGRLTPEERAEINLHPVIGGNIMKPLRFFPRERDLILHHHENFDGSGYPDKLAGTDIPLTARILSVADAYDAMTSSRPYRASRSHKLAAEELIRCSNTQFDGEIVRIFLHAVKGIDD